MEPEKLLEATNEELVQSYLVASIREEDAQAEKSAIKEELLTRMKTDGMMVGSYAVTRVKLVTFKTSLDDARTMGATKEAVDTSVLKKLYNTGADIPGSAVTFYIKISEVKPKE